REAAIRNEREEGADAIAAMTLRLEHEEAKRKLAAEAHREIAANRAARVAVVFAPSRDRGDLVCNSSSLSRRPHSAAPGRTYSSSSPSVAADSTKVDCGTST